MAAVPPARKSGKLHSGRIPQAGTTEPAHWRAMEFSEAIKKSGQPVPCVGMAARLVALWMAWRLWILPPIRERERVAGDRWVKFLFTLQARAGVFWKEMAGIGRKSRELAGNIRRGVMDI